MALGLGCSTFYIAYQAVFFGLLNDLFPSVNPPRLVDDTLNSCVREVCEDMSLWPDDAFVLKVRLPRRWSINSSNALGLTENEASL